LELEVAGKAPKVDTQSKVDACLRDLSSKTTELAAKASLQDVTTLLDGKADVDEVNAALLEINRQMNLKASLSEISNTLHEQSLLNSALVTELCLGRWIWKSLKTLPGGTVPWNMQTANSDPDNLLWEKDKAGITCVSPGLYEIQVMLVEVTIPWTPQHNPLVRGELTWLVFVLHSKVGFILAHEVEFIFWKWDSF
jgi:hypothetical protein